MFKVTMKDTIMSNIYEWLGIANDASEAEILAAIQTKKQQYRLNSSQEVNIKQVMLNQHLRQHHDLRLANDFGMPLSGSSASIVFADSELAFTPADIRTLTHTKLKKKAPKPNVYLYGGLLVVLLALLVSLVVWKMPL